MSRSRPKTHTSEPVGELLAQALAQVRALGQSCGLHPISPRRGLKREEAALYVGLSVTKFTELIARGLMPQPKRIDGRVVWDVRALDLAFDDLPDDAAQIEDTWADFQ